MIEICIGFVLIGVVMFLAIKRIDLLSKRVDILQKALWELERHTHQ